MGRSRYKIYEEAFPYFITSSIVDELPLFSDPELAKIVLDAICFLQKDRGVFVYGYVIMENHIHFIAQTDDLAEKIRNFKSYTARKIVESLELRGRNRFLKWLSRAKLSYKRESNYQVWQEGYYPKQIRGDAMMLQKLEYIHQNPVKRGYVDFPEYWRYSSARNYNGLEGLIPITMFRR